METKECKACGESKPLSQYNKLHISADGLAYKCRPCSKAEYKSYRKSKSEEEMHLLDRERNLRKSFGIGLSDYEAMLEKQKGVCAICKEEETTVRQGRVQSLSVDHCHETGKIRGLLCNSCNRALGKFKDSIEHLMAAASYLEEHA
jgi:hypothetical protein